MRVIVRELSPHLYYAIPYVSDWYSQAVIIAASDNLAASP